MAVKKKKKCIKQAGSTSKLINECYGSWVMKEKKSSRLRATSASILSPLLSCGPFCFVLGEAIPVFSLLDVPSPV